MAQNGRGYRGPFLILAFREREKATFNVQRSTSNAQFGEVLVFSRRLTIARRCGEGSGMESISRSENQRWRLLCRRTFCRKTVSFTRWSVNGNVAVWTGRLQLVLLRNGGNIHMPDQRLADCSSKILFCLTTNTCASRSRFSGARAFFMG